MAQRERFDRELEIAREVQGNLFLSGFPRCRVGLLWTMLACARGGPVTTIDFLELPKRRLGIAIGDVSGKASEQR